MPLIDEIRKKTLIKLAKTSFDPDLKPAELKVLHDSAGAEITGQLNCCGAKLKTTDHALFVRSV
jgi:hypothetical protein